MVYMVVQYLFNGESETLPSLGPKHLPMPSCPVMESQMIVIAILVQPDVLFANPEL